MEATASVQSTISTEQHNEEFKAQLSAYLQKQHPIIRGLHWALQGLALVCMMLAVCLYFIALYQTVLWAATGSFTSLGQATQLPNAWVNFGLSMSFLVFPWGLDSMLLRLFPAFLFPIGAYRSNKPLHYITGIRAFIAGFGITCAGAPGAAHIVGLILQVIR
jgi:Flp pilus assembly protein TadB